MFTINMIYNVAVMVVLTINPISSQTYFWQSSNPLTHTVSSLHSYLQPTIGALSNPFSVFDSSLQADQSQISNREPFMDTDANRCGVLATSCRKSRYRTIDGTCNNLGKPSWGSPNNSYARLLPAKYGDGVSTPTDVGIELPLPRVISLTLFPDIPIQDPLWTLAAMQYGQIITHDVTLAAGTTQINKHRVQCCQNGMLLDQRLTDDHCYPVLIPKNDPYLQGREECQTFLRTVTNRDRGCVTTNEQVEQLFAVTSYADLSLVYGISEIQSANLREFVGGRLLVQKRRDGRTFPPNLQNTSNCDTSGSQQKVCYMAGDTRANQNPQLTVLQVILLREHNRLANALQAINPHWSDEIVFQEARRILIAQHQHITYYEWLPIFIGEENARKHKVIYDLSAHNNLGYVNDYDETINPHVINEFATAAFRYFHSAIAGRLQLFSESRSVERQVRLSDWFNKPVLLEQNDNFDGLSRGMCTQPELQVDPFFDSEITQFLFRAQNKFGSDLRAIDVQRNRDHGLASYNDVRNFCGLPRAHTFDDLADLISRDNIEKLQALYANVDDIDLTVGGSLEAHVPGTLSGPTFLCIITEQFYRTRVADRYFYENGNADTGFTIEQLAEIRKASMARWFCDNGDNIVQMQREAFKIPSAANPVIGCESIAQIDLGYWKDINGPRSVLQDVPVSQYVDDTYPSSDYLFNFFKK